MDCHYPLHFLWTSLGCIINLAPSSILSESAKEKNNNYFDLLPQMFFSLSAACQNNCMKCQFILQIVQLYKTMEINQKKKHTIDLLCVVCER